MPRQRGVALVITLVMLAIITIVAVIFLGLARRNRAGVSLHGSQTDAEFAAEYALQRAKAEVMSQIRFTNQLLAFDLITSHGLDRPPFANTPMRDPMGNGQAGPVLVKTNFTNPNAPLESRFYLDLNRTRSYDPTILNPFPTNRLAGDPEWIFIPDKATNAYGPNNHFLARYAYIVLPVGKALDLNAIHNTNGFAGGFVRNQGVGAFEINLAAFLNEFDPTIWTYNYDPLRPTPLSVGTAFADATNFVHYRNNVTGVSPLSLANLFGPASVQLTNNGVDDLGDDLPPGSVFIGGRPLPDNDNVAKAYAGAESLRHYFSHQDLFDPAKTSGTFVNNLRQALTGGTNGYRFYELAAQLATDTGPETRDRINLNWANLGTNSVSQLIPWDATPALATMFFTNAAQRILRGMVADFFPVTNVNAIMIWPTNYYGNAVHRVMQVAANIFDAGRTNQFPSVFRPLFGNLGTTNVYITGWTNDNSIAGLNAWMLGNGYDIPAVIGAKKGLPNFNEYMFQSDTLVTRKLQLTRPDTNALPNWTNQMYFLGMSNTVAVESWNSYAQAFPFTTTIQITNIVTITITNALGLRAGGTYSLAVETNLTSWPGFAGFNNPNAVYSFKIPLFTNIVLLTNSVYYFKPNQFVGVNTNSFEDGHTMGDPFQLPDWQLSISNHLVYRQTLGTNVLDFVVLKTVTATNLSEFLPLAPTPPTPLGVSVWDTNRVVGATGPSEGIRAQIAFSQMQGAGTEWTDFDPNAKDRNNAARKFNDFMLGKGTSLTNQTPFNPVARITEIAAWQANDPLVHYHVGDLSTYPPVAKAARWKDAITASATENPSSLTNVNKSYSPWGGQPGSSAESAAALDFRLKDPGVDISDRWDFPSHKYPNVGWLGKVHRGTPWQTVYFKAGAAPLADWRAVANDPRNHPTNDFKLLDIFTAALTDNAARGLLSINQSRLPAWSAALSGVVVLTNNLDDDTVMDPVTRTNSNRYFPVVIQPTGGLTNSPLWVVWDAIQRERRRVGGVFTDFSQLLQIPELTTHSPYLNWVSENQKRFGIDDYAYERIPQQILGLLRVGEPRFVVYAYGQALKPSGVDTRTGFTTNYQITAEFATRTVMRVDGTAQKPRAVVESFNILPPD